MMKGSLMVQRGIVLCLSSALGLLLATYTPISTSTTHREFYRQERDDVMSTTVSNSMANPIKEETNKKVATFVAAINAENKYLKDQLAVAAALIAKKDNEMQQLTLQAQSSQTRGDGNKAIHKSTSMFAEEVPEQSTPFDESQLKVTYESCMRSLQEKPHEKTFKGKLYWLHFPKCGTSFGVTLHGYTCQSDPSPKVNPSKPGEECNRCGLEAQNWRGFDHTIKPSIQWETRPYCDWNITFEGAFKNHIVLPSTNDYSSPSHSQAVALFRDPRRRLLSGWNDNKHSYALGSFQVPRNPIDEVAVMRNSTKTIEEYAAWPGIGGCQTKMLLGEDCAAPINITMAMFEEAQRRVLNMPFVGLTDAFNASVCLWHHQFGGLPEPYMFTTHSRSAEEWLKKPNKLLQCGLGDRLPREHWKTMSTDIDDIDHAIYTTAKAVFASRLQKYGLWGPDHQHLKHACRNTNTLPLKSACRFNWKK
eukprot:m.44371 g.44371  ORF g.44371 m.44371 type:complete len:476 (+) comp19664_c0_seq3:2115-3542(+)